jgi:molybdopterin converting factor small subunit
MKLRVQYTAQLRTAAGRPEEDIELPEGSTLAALLLHLAERLDEAAVAHVMAPEGHIRKGLLLVVNDAVASADTAHTTVLRPGDVVLLLPPIAGG